MTMNKYRLGIDIGSTTVKIAILDDNNNILFSDYERHFANIQETLQSLLEKAVAQLVEFEIYPVITGSGGLTLAKHLEVPFTQEVVAVSTALQDYAPQCDVAIELGGEVLGRRYNKIIILIKKFTNIKLINSFIFRYKTFNQTIVTFNRVNYI